MDKFVIKSQTPPSLSVTMSTRSSSSSTSTPSVKPKQSKTSRGKMPQVLAHTSSSPDSPTLSPELLTDGDITPPHLTPCRSPSSPVHTDSLQAATVAQEVSRLLLPLIDKRLDVLHTSITSALALITTNTKKITELENRTSSCEDTTATLSQTINQQQSEIASLRDKLDDLENRGRRNNLRFIGIPEAIKGDQLNAFLTKDLIQALDLPLPSDPLIIERVHRIGPSRDRAGDRPRQVIAKFQNWSTKEMILRTYRRRDNTTVGGSRILIFQDFSALVTQKRKAFTPICRYLHQSAIQFQLQYPAKLRVADNGGTHIFTEPAEARRHFRIPDEGP